jgi:hypothetical protein
LLSGYFEHFYETGFSHIKYILKIYFKNILNMTNKIFVRQTCSEILIFMYLPVINSLRKYLSVLNHPVINHPVINHNVWNIDFNLCNTNYNELVKGDILIWVGINEPSFVKFTKKSVYTIHFNLEPDVKYSNSNEIWTYSLYIYNEYIKTNKLNKLIKFIPIIYEETTNKVNYFKKNDLELCFLGNLNYDRKNKEKIINSSNVNIKEIYNLWTNKDFDKFIVKNKYIYLNLNKGNTRALPSVRINKLLSHKCIIISEHTNSKEEKLYKDFVYFKKLDEIGDFYKSFLTKSNTELEEIAENMHQKFLSIFKFENAISLIKKSH